MRFRYRYQDKTGRVLEGETSAASEAEAYSSLRRTGVRPMKVWPRPGILNALSRLGRRGYAIILLSLALAAALSLYLANMSPGNTAPVDAALGNAALGDATPSPLPLPLPRRPLAPCSLSFANPVDELLARFAVPARAVDIDLAACRGAEFDRAFAAAVATPVAISSNDAPAAVEWKRVLAGIKEECRVALASGEKPQAVVARLVERQKMEKSYRDGAIAELARIADPVRRAERRAAVERMFRAMGFDPLP